MKIAIKSLIVLLAFSLLISGALGAPAPTVTNMPGSLTSSVSGSGTVAGSIATTTTDNLALPVLAADQPVVTQNIFLSAAVPTGQTGAAKADFTPSTAQSATITRAGTAGVGGSAVGDPVYSLNAQLKDNPTGHVEVAVTTGGVTPNFATAQLFSTATTTPLAAAGPVTDVLGRTFLDAQLHLDGVSSGSASASGTGSFSSSASGALVPVAPATVARDTTVTGTISGTVKINGSVAAGGSITGLTNPTAADFYLGAASVNGAGYRTQPLFTRQPTAEARLEANAFATTLAAGIAPIGGQPSYQAQTFSFGSAISTASPISSGITKASGLIEGSSTATALTSNLAAAPATLTLNGAAKQEALRSEFAANSNYILDETIGYARTYSEINSIGPFTVLAAQLGAYGEAAAYGSGSRSTTGNDQAYGYGNISSLKWSGVLSTAMVGAAPILNHNNPSVSVSGTNGFVAGVLPGFRASATLEDRASTPSQTFTDAYTGAQYDTTVPAVAMRTQTGVQVSLTAPFYPTALRDAAGGWVAMQNGVATATDSGAAGKVVSTTISNWNAVKWIQGLDPSQTTGFTTPSPLSDPTFVNPGVSVKPTDGPNNTPTSRGNNYQGNTFQSVVL